MARRQPKLRHPLVLVTAMVVLAVGLCLATSRARPETAPRVVLVIVSLADNEHQGIIPVPARLGNGDDPANNLYWGARYGLKTFFSRSANWTLAGRPSAAEASILERCVFKHKRADVYLVAEAYAGRSIKEAIRRFLRGVSGKDAGTLEWTEGQRSLSLPCGSGADLFVYVGHNGLMDFDLDETYAGEGAQCREAMILACFSRSYFTDALRAAKACPLLWTTGLMAPEAYTLESALEAWVAGETADRIRLRAAAAYANYQKISPAAAQGLLVAGW